MTLWSEIEPAPRDEWNGHDRRRFATRRALLEAGRKLFAQSGRDVSIAALAAHAGVAKGSFFNHFRTKEALFDEVVRRTMLALIEQASLHEPPTTDPLEIPAWRIWYGIRSLLADRDACHLLVHAGPAVSGGPVDAGIRPTVLASIREGAKAGVLRPIDPEMLYAAYFGVVSQGIGHLLVREDAPSPEVGADQILELVLAVLGLPTELVDRVRRHRIEVT